MHICERDGFRTIFRHPDAVQRLQLAYVLMLPLYFGGSASSAVVRHRLRWSEVVER